MIVLTATEFGRRLRGRQRLTDGLLQPLASRLISLTSHIKKLSE